MEETLKEFIKIFRSEVSQRDTEHVIFHGCWDWHSSVHGHWALLESAHLVKDNENLEWVTKRLQNKNMEEEKEKMKNKLKRKNPENDEFN